MTSKTQNDSARILVVDDNPSIHRDFNLVLLDDLQDLELEADEQRLFGQHARRRIARPAYALDHALSGLEGVDKVKLALAEARPYQLAFVDIRMPGIDGVETIRRFWQIDPRVQVVICTAFADYSWADLVERLGTTDKLLVLKKPFDNIEVIQLAGTLTEKWFLARQAALKLEQMELLVAQRTRRLLELQRSGRPPEHAQMTGAATVAETDGAEAGLEPPLILVVAGETGGGAMAAQGLGADFRVVEARTGEQALSHARETVPDLILMELQAPGLNGLELCRRVKEHELACHIPVILLGTSGRQQAQLEALEAGADDFLAPPFSPAAVRARVEHLLQSRRGPDERLRRDDTLHPRDLAINQVDARFLRRTVDIIEAHLADFEFDVDALARKLAVSRRQLFRKLKGVTGCTPNAFIRTLRLKRAAQLLAESQMTVTEITYAVGFSDLKHFRTVFREQFGVLPGDYTRTGPNDAA